MTTDARFVPTDRQRQVLCIIYEHLCRCAEWPTIREIGAALGCRSPNAVQGHLEALRMKGFVENLNGPRIRRGGRSGDRSRGYRLRGVELRPFFTDDEHGRALEELLRAGPAADAPPAA